MKTHPKPHLLAKGRKQGQPDRGFYLQDHTEEVLFMVRFLFDGCPFAFRLHGLMQLPLPIEELRRLALLSALCHDLGKAGGEFQAMLWDMEIAYQKGQPEPKARYRQGYRHEQLSALLLWGNPDLQQWVEQQAGNHDNFLLVVSAVLGHHVKSHQDPVKPKEPQARIYLTQASAHFKPLAARFGFEGFPLLQDEVWDWEDDFEERWLDFENENDFLTRDETPTSAALKWILMIGDVLGSFSPPLDDAGQLTPGYREILCEAIAQGFEPPLVDYKTRVQQKNPNIMETLHGFQQETLDKSDHDVLLTVACGRGKTTAAYLWAKPDQRLIFTLPTTGTATLLFEEYGVDTDELRHSRSAVDAKLRQDILNSGPGNTPDTEKDESEQAQGMLRDLQSLFHDVTLCTVDQLLGFLAFNRRSILWLLYIVQSQVVFDEFHCYDDTLRAWHLRFMEWFPKLRVLNMSATAASFQKAYIQKARPGLSIITDRKTGSDPASLKRHRIEIIAEEDAPKVFKGNSALWIVNLVKEAQSLGLQNPQALVLHSRFRYQDRRALQTQLVQQFRQGAQGITTQVAEISLDISAQTLVSAVCPVHAIIQRLGRHNRHDPRGVRPAFFYLPEKGLPYEELELVSALDWLQSLAGRDLSQWDLDDAFQQFPFTPKPYILGSRMVKTARAALRQIDSPHTCLLAQDMTPAMRDPRLPHHHLQALEIPAWLDEKHLKVAEPFRYRHIVNLPYDPRLGLLS